MFWDNFMRLCIENGTKPNPVASELGIASGSLTKWKNGGVPSGKSLQKIANYFNVSVDALLYGAHETSDSFGGFDKQKIRPIPLYESVSAGFGVCANDSIVDYIPMTFSSESEAKETIAIKVTGDSMYPKIEDGDTIIVHKQTSVDSGSVAVLLLDGEEGIVKKVIYGNDWIELHSFNPIYPTRRFEGENILRLQVLGLVKQVIKNI